MDVCTLVQKYNRYGECYIQGPLVYHLDGTFGIPGSECNMDSAGGARICVQCNAVRSKLHTRVVGWRK